LAVLLQSNLRANIQTQAPALISFSAAVRAATDPDALRQFHLSDALRRQDECRQNAFRTAVGAAQVA
jgi:hypothetical protein